MEPDIATKTTLLLQSRHVWRWGIVNMARRQSVAEHSYLVWAIGSKMYDECAKGHNTVERHDFTYYLLTHDSEEAVMGDMPSTVKDALNDLWPGGFDRLCRHVMGGWGHTSVYAGHWLNYLYKAADLTEAILFCEDNDAPTRVIKYLQERLLKTFDVARTQFPEQCDWQRAEGIAEWVINHADSD